MELVFEIFLWIWFLGCIITWRIGKYILVEGMGIRSAEFVMLILYSTSIILSLVIPVWGRYFVTGILCLWLIIQFFCHWYYTLFGATEQKIKAYNECFQNTIRIFPQSDKRIVPDFYHIVLHLLIILNIITNW